MWRQNRPIVIVYQKALKQLVYVNLSSIICIDFAAEKKRIVKEEKCDERAGERESERARDAPQRLFLRLRIV